MRKIVSLSSDPNFKVDIQHIYLQFLTSDSDIWDTQNPAMNKLVEAGRSVCGELHVLVTALVRPSRLQIFQRPRNVQGNSCAVSRLHLKSVFCLRQTGIRWASRMNCKHRSSFFFFLVQSGLITEAKWHCTWKVQQTAAGRVVLGLFGSFGNLRIQGRKMLCPSLHSQSVDPNNLWDLMLLWG